MSLRDEDAIEYIVSPEGWKESRVVLRQHNGAVGLRDRCRGTTLPDEANDVHIEVEVELQCCSLG